MRRHPRERRVRSRSRRPALAPVVGKVPPTLVSPELLLTGKARSRAACGLRDVSLPPWLVAVSPWRIALVPRLVASHVCLLVAARAAILEKVVHLSGDTPLDSTQIIGVEVRAPVVTHLAKYLRAARGIGMLCYVQCKLVLGGSECKAHRLGHIVLYPFSFFS